MDVGKLGSQVQVGEAKPATTAKDAARLEKGRQACKDFESILLYQMLSTMRKAFDSEGESSTDFGGDVFKSMIDEQLSTALSRAGGLGLSKLMEQGLGLVDSKTGALSGVRSGAVRIGRTLGERVSAAGLEEAGTRADRQAPARSTETETASVKTVSAEPASTSVRIDQLETAEGPNTGNLRPYESTIRAASQVFGLSADLIRAVILHESGGNPYAISSKGAKGLMQLTDETSQTLGVSNPFNPVQNIFAGARYLGSLVKMFEGDLRLALASYNAGSGVVKKYGDVPPYRETQDYVNKVMQSFERLQADTEGTGHVYKS